MNIIQAIGVAVSYFFDGCIELFSPNHDDYPLSGVQPFEGESPPKRSSISRPWY
ncbi:MAG: isochorismate synthase [Leptolyngbyaceae cyanobacterium CSU_1_4]|nr:isochorismate synthase [Leptolyngbyaceae cyanobacterium CSU_1_4]